MKNLKISQMVVAAYIILSALFITYSAWTYLENSFYKKGVSDGQTSAVVQLINEANKCEPFTVFAGENKIKLQKTDCDTGK